jgi:enterochelin esterase-like enzyme
MTFATLLAAAALLPGFAPAGPPSPGRGVLLRGVFPDALAPQPLSPGYVYLPPNFSPTRRYPVIYLLHGIRGNPTEYVKALSLPSYADQQIEAGLLRPFIAVMPAAADSNYRGEWAGPWEEYITHAVVPFVDRFLPTIAEPSGRVLAGLSAGGYGAFDIGLRDPHLFGALESWSGYFHPLHDTPFRDVGITTLRANDPQLLLRRKAKLLRRLDIRFFVSTGPYHSRWAPPSESTAFAGEARALRLLVTYRSFPSRRGHWRDEFHAGLSWAFAV